MKPSTLLALALLIGLARMTHAQAPPPAPAATAVTITVSPGARQTFRGFGVSLLPYPDGFAALSPARRREMARLLWRDHHIKILRLWLPVPDYSPKPRADGQTYIRDDRIPVWMTMLAGLIARMRDQYHVQISAAGIVNEPGQEKKYSVTRMAVAVRDLRADPDARGLRSVQIVAPESANTAVGADELSGYIAAMEADPAAFQALGGVATHNYNMGNTDAVEPYVARTGKPYWITEAGGDGVLDKPGDAVSAASAASRFLSDMDHLVTHWVWFLGGESVSESIDDPNTPAGGSRMIQYKTGPGAHWYRVMQVSYPLQQIGQTFDVGAVFRKSVSSLDGGMGWSYGRKPRVTAAAARNPDGTWGIGLSNYTADAFPDFDPFHKDNSGYPAQTFAVTLVVPELARVKTLRFVARRSNVGANDVPAGTLVMHSGRLLVPGVSPLDVLTLRSLKGSP